MQCIDDDPRYQQAVAELAALRSCDWCDQDDVTGDHQCPHGIYCAVVLLRLGGAPETEELDCQECNGSWQRRGRP